MMDIYLSIDDTDNADSPGSGQLAEILSNRLKHKKLIWRSTSVSRHQLHVHEDIPYTSHNSSMCFTAVTTDDRLDDLIGYSIQFLTERSAQGSDPGLCVAVNRNSLDRSALIEFGLAAKENILSKDDAYTLAEKVGVHLSEHGGSGDGVIGALAGIGLRMQGYDGRFRGWLKLSNAGQIVTAGYLSLIDSVECVVDTEGSILPGDARVKISESKIKTIVHNHQQVIPVKQCVDMTSRMWATLSENESKQV